MDPKEPSKNSLSIRLSESVVFLKGGTHARRNGTEDIPRSMLRGLLTLQLVKPTYVTYLRLSIVRY